MIKTLCLKLLGLFTKKGLGILFKILFTQTTSVLFNDLIDYDNQMAAYNFVKELNNRDDIDTLEKAKIFNKKMLEWAKKEGKKLSTSLINFLREWAVNMIKKEKGL